VDARLTAQPRYPMRLHPNEWKSGEIVWIIDIAGDSRAVQGMMEQLAKTAFQGKQVRMLTMGNASQAQE